MCEPQKRGCLTGSQDLNLQKGVDGKEGCSFHIKNKLVSEMINDKNSL